MVGTQIVLVACPPGGYPGQALSIAVPREHQNDDVVTEQQQQHQVSPPPPRPVPPPRPNTTTPRFEVIVPPGIRPGTPFSLVAGGQRILVRCPLNAREGDRVRFKVPPELLDRPKVVDETALIRLTYKKDGWARNLRLTDMKFQWVRMDEKGDVDERDRFDSHKSAYVRKLHFRRSKDGMQKRVISLVPAADAVADSCIKSPDGRVLVSNTDLAAAQNLSYQEKVKWFHETCDRILKIPYESGHMQINVRRDSLTVDSVNAIVSMSRKELRKYWKFSFLSEGDIGIDAGGLTREWFQLVTEDIMNGDFGLWQSSIVNQMCMQINPSSGTSVIVCETSRYQRPNAHVSFWPILVSILL
jgi:hypothetical protein